MMLGAKILFPILQLLIGPQFSHQRSTPSSPTYMAAVVEYAAPLGISLDNKEEHFRHNVEMYGEFAKAAAAKGADIIVFPEYGLVSEDLPRNPDGFPALALPVPAPDDKVNPCVGTTGTSYEGLKNLSCTARDSNIYMVVNLPEKAPCPSSCPGKDIFYNTNVVFDRTGTIIARYRKFHLFGELGFSSPSEVEISVFQTDFGVVFGTFTCFDVMFEDPGEKLVEGLGVQDIVFPTAWFSEMPFLTAVQTQAAWARTMDVNFLASGYNYPAVGSAGSGIYAGKSGAVVAVMPNTRGSFLLLGSVPKKTNKSTYEVKPSGSIIPLSTILSGTEGRPSGGLTGDYSQGAVDSGLLLKKENLGEYMMSSVNTDVIGVYNLIIRDLQCSFKLTLNSSAGSPDLSQEVIPQKRFPNVYRLVAYNGVRSFDGIANGGLKVCAAILCANESEDSCGVVVEHPEEKYTFIEKIEVSATFNRGHSIFLPSTLLDETLMPVPADNFDFETRDVDEDKIQVIMRSKVDNFSFLTFGIYGRNFTLDSWK